MSVPPPGLLRPNSAIYLGAVAASEDERAAPSSPSSPLLSPGGTSVVGRLPQLPSPPHTSSTSGSAGERDREGAHTGPDIVERTKQEVIELPATVVMQNGERDHPILDNDPKRIHHRQQHSGQEEDDRTAKLSPNRSLVEKNKEIHDRLDRFGTLGNGRSPGRIMSPASRTISLGRASSALAAATAAAAAASTTNSMRHASMTLPPRESRERDVFDRDDSILSNGRSHSASNSLSAPYSHSNSNSDIDDRSTTPPATPAKPFVELSQNPGSTNTSPQRKRLVSEPTSPHRFPFLRDRTQNRPSESAANLSSPLKHTSTLSSPLGRSSPLTNTVGRSSTVNSPGASSLRRVTTLNRGELGTVEEDRDRRSPATRKARTPIPLEFLTAADQDLHPPESIGDRSRQPSPGLYTSEGAPSSPGLYVSEDVGGSRTSLSGTGSIRSTRRPRPPGIRSSIDRQYEQWEREQMGDAGFNAPQAAHESAPETSSNRRMSSAVGTGVRAIVNESLRAAGLTRAQEIGGSGSGAGGIVASPVIMKSREQAESLDMIHSGSTRLSSGRDRSRSRLSVDHRGNEPMDMDSLREMVGRNTFFSPNVRGVRTIHNVLNPSTSSDVSGPEEERGAIINTNEREAPAKLRSLKTNYISSLNSPTPASKSLTSPPGTQRYLPSRSTTALSMSNHGNEPGTPNNPRGPRTPSPMKNAPLPSAQSSPSTVNGSDPIHLLQSALAMFESHVQKLPLTAPDTANDVLRDARGIVQTAVALSGALHSAAAVCVEQHIDAETDTGNGGVGAAEVWQRAGKEFREGSKVADELVRALTNFMIGTGRMLRRQNTGAGYSGHGRVKSIGGGGEGSVSRAGGSVLARGSSLSRAGGSSDGRRSVEGWTLGVGLSGADRRSMDGRRSVEPGAHPGSRRSADDYREDTMRRLTSRQGSARDLGEAGSNDSGGSRDRPLAGAGASQRMSFQAYGSGSESRPTTSHSLRRDPSRVSHEEPLASPSLRTFTALSSRRSTGHPTPAMGNQKALPRLPLLPQQQQQQQQQPGGELNFPQSENGGDRTPIELLRPHTRHLTMPALALPPPLPMLPSESLLNRSKSIGKHAASNSVTSASTASTTRPQLPHSTSSTATVRGSGILPATGSTVATTAVTPTTARPREMSFTVSGNGGDASNGLTSIGRTGGSAAINGLQQIAIGNPIGKRTATNADEEYSEEDPRTARLLSSVTNASGTLSPMAKSSSASHLGFPLRGSESPGGNGSPSLEPRRPSVRPIGSNRRTSSTLSGTSHTTFISSALGATTTPVRPRAVTRISSTGALTLPNPALNGSKGSLASAGGGGTSNGNATDGSEERKLRRSRVRLSLNAVLDRRGGIGELLGARTRPVPGAGGAAGAAGYASGGRSALEGGEGELSESPSVSARLRRERRAAAEGEQLW